MTARRTYAFGVARSILALALSGFLSAHVHADTHTPPLITMAGDSGYAPYQFLGPAGKASGFDVALLKAVAREAGLNVQFQLGDWGQALHRLRDGKVDVVPMFISPERQKLYDFSNPYIVRYHLIFSRRGTPYVNSLQELAGKEVIVQRAGLAADALKQLGIRVIPILTDKEPETLRMLAAGAHDYAIAPAFIGRYAIKKYNIHNVVVSGPPVLTQEYAFAVTKGNTALLKSINGGLVALKQSGRFERIYTDWLANLEPPQEIKAYLLHRYLWISAAFLALIVALFVFSQKLRTQVQKQALVLKDEFTRRIRAEKRARYLAYTDALTELPNRNQFVNELDRVVEQAKVDGHHVGVQCIKVVNLPQINEAAGYHVGDELLKHIGRQLSELCRSRASALSPGQFAVLLVSPTGSQEIVEEAGYLLRRLYGTRQIAGISLEVNFRSGLAIFPAHGESAMSLIRNSELALRVSRDSEQGFVTYSTDFESDSRNFRLLVDLPVALRESQFDLYCQPKLALREPKIVGGEILVRWQHPEFGLLGPNLFVPLAEKSGFIREITLHIVERVTDCLRTQYPHGEFPKFSVNVSAKDLASRDFGEKASKLIDGYSSRATFEITETAAMHDTRSVLRTAAALREGGIRLSIDDYGTSYSSLNYLRQLQPDELKIDREFVCNMLNSKDDRIVVESTIHLAHELGMTVVAEGTEDLETVGALASMDCDEVQGYVIAKPMTTDDFREWSAATDPAAFMKANR